MQVLPPFDRPDTDTCMFYLISFEMSTHHCNARGAGPVYFDRVRSSPDHYLDQRIAWVIFRSVTGLEPVECSVDTKRSRKLTRNTRPEQARFGIWKLPWWEQWTLAKATCNFAGFKGTAAQEVAIVLTLIYGTALKKRASGPLHSEIVFNAFDWLRAEGQWNLPRCYLCFGSLNTMPEPHRSEFDLMHLYSQRCVFANRLHTTIWR